MKDDKNKIQKFAHKKIWLKYFVYLFILVNSRLVEDEKELSTQLILFSFI